MGQVEIATTGWLQGTLLGNLATTALAIAVTGIGLQALMGRIDLRTSARTLLGCFILLGATSIVSGLRQSVAAGAFDNGANRSLPAVAAVPENFDPYAGAAVPDLNVSRD